jgi:uncharacterized protein YhfF
VTVEPRREDVAAFWRAYRATLPPEQSACLPDFPDAWGFGDGPAMADELGALALAGVKTATCGLLWEYEAELEPLPEPGQLSVILDGAGRPLCLIGTTEVRVLPYQDVDAQFAYDEGEGDRSLAYWRAEHWKYFSRYLAELGRQPAMDMPLVCERFRVVFTPADASAGG